MIDNFSSREKKIATKILQVLVEEKASNLEADEILNLVKGCYRSFPVTSVQSEIEEVLMQLL